MNMQHLHVGLFLQVATSGRLWSLAAVALGLAAVIIGWRALARAVPASSKRSRGITAVTAGLLGVALSGLQLGRATGGVGTGNGVAGAVVAIVLGLAGIILGGRALARARRISTDQ